MQRDHGILLCVSQFKLSYFSLSLSAAPSGFASWLIWLPPPPLYCHRLCHPQPGPRVPKPSKPLPLYTMWCDAPILSRVSPFWFHSTIDILTLANRDRAQSMLRLEERKKEDGRERRKWRKKENGESKKHRWKNGSSGKEEQKTGIVSARRKKKRKIKARERFEIENVMAALSSFLSLWFFFNIEIVAGISNPNGKTKWNLTNRNIYSSLKTSNTYTFSFLLLFLLFLVFFFLWRPLCVQTQNTVYEIVSEMNTRQDVMEERLSTLEEKLTLLQETLEALPEAISRYLPAMVNNPPSGGGSGWTQPPQTENNGTELQRRQQFLHPESTYGSIGSGGGGGGANNSSGGGGVTHSRSSPGTWTATSPAGAAASTSAALPVPAQPPQPPPLPSKPKLS